VIRRLKQFERRRAITLEDLEPLESEAEELGRMLGGFIKYLQASNFSRRGSYRPGRAKPNANRSTAGIGRSRD
jgi:hypothetical protein